VIFDVIHAEYRSRDVSRLFIHGAGASIYPSKPDGSMARLGGALVLPARFAARTS
jgi:hypothetical protein